LSVESWVRHDYVSTEIEPNIVVVVGQDRCYLLGGISEKAEALIRLFDNAFVTVIEYQPLKL